MKTAFSIGLAGAIALLAAGCTGGSNNDQATQTNTSTQNNSQTVQNSGANNSPVVQPEIYAQRKSEVAGLTQAIQQYNAAEGHYPKTLQDLTPDYIARVPQPPAGYKLNYDPNSGAVNMVRQ